MKTVIIAPHPDDEWIGCGCILLKKTDNKEKIKVLIITKEARTERRIKISKLLAKEHNYSLKILGEPEKQININNLKKFFRKNIGNDNTVYIPDYDMHPDHRLINTVAKKFFNKNNLIEYAVYNNSKNIYIRLRNKLSALMTGKRTASFRLNKENMRIKYRLNLKNKNIIKFGEIPRNSDVLRMYRDQKIS